MPICTSCSPAATAWQSRAGNLFREGEFTGMSTADDPDGDGIPSARDKLPAGV